MRDADSVLADTGGFGRYQYIVSTWGIVCSCICGMHVMANYFTTIKPQGECPSDPCSDPQWCLNTTHAFSIPIDFKGCDPPAWAGPAVGSSFFIGWFFGGLACGRISDLHGRFTVSFLMIALGPVVYALSTFSTGIEVYYVFSFLHGAAIGGVALVTYVLTVESLPSAYSSMVGTMVLGSFAVGVVAEVPLAYHLPNWREFTCAVSLLVVPVLLYYPFICESPRWLSSSGRHREAAAVYARIASVNKASYDPNRDAPSQQDVAEASARGPQPDASYSDLCAFPEIRRRSLVMVYAWFTCALTYYGLNFASGDLGGDLYVNAVVIAAVELPTFVLQGFTVEMSMFGRKRTCYLGFFVGGLCCLLYPVCIVLDMQTTGRVLAFAGKMGVTIAFTVVYIWGAELFPTDIRLSAMGACTASARVGALISPFAARANTNLALLAFGIAAVFAGVLCFLLPETLGKEPPDTLEELQRGFGRSQTPLDSSILTSSMDSIVDDAGDIQESVD
eukprot:TRINITY_DN1560_c0_g3_i7.p1 TRINITY_DN1560_c0_g3~~TRINITY_DN1560_c0_g3_i7.p1  ORF type:complete len:504 (+),score=148.00 TRINITY_DN1560_c0_g3_i7:99-1610(+)